MRFFIIVGALAIFSSPSYAQPAPVPPEYQDLYDSLSGQISTFETTVNAGWDGSLYPYLNVPALTSANSDLFTTLIQDGYYDNTVLTELQELQALGAQGITVHIDFPVLYQPYYTTNPSQYQSFVDFYQQLASDVHARGLKLIVETTTCEPLPGTQGSSFAPYYQSLSWTDYMNGRAQNAVNVAQLIQPDYMSVITEPDTEQYDTGQVNAGNPTGSLQLLQTIMAALNSAQIKNIQIGAGAGAWTPDLSQYISNFVKTSVNYIDTHIYPLNYNCFLAALTAADSITAAGKQVTVSEAWPLKVRDSEIGSLTISGVDARNPFSFWSPIDTAFLKALVDYANYKHVTFISPAWSLYFSAYLDYNVYGGMSDDNILTDAYQAASTARNAGLFTITGHSWEKLILPAPDTMAPGVPAVPVASTIGVNIVNLTWPPSYDNVGVAGYRVYRNSAYLISTSSPNFYDSGLTSGATYTYALSAFDAAGNGSAVSAPLTIQTINTNPPTVPQNLAVLGTTNVSVSLQWTPSTDAGGPVAGYKVLRGTSPDSMILHATTSASAYVDNGVYPLTTYYYAVEAYIDSGISSAPSGVVTATTTAGY